MARRIRKRPTPPMPGYNEKTGAHRLLGRAFAKLGNDNAPAYPVDKKDQNPIQAPLDPLEEKEREEIRLSAIKRAAEHDRLRREKNEKNPKERPPEDFYFSP
jgi:hypothetical protein